MMVDIMSRARRASEERAASVDAALAKAGILGEAVPSVMTYSEVSRSFGEMCRFADLVVLGRPYGDDMSSTAVDMLEGALFDGDAGVLVCPNGRARPDSPDSDVVLIAWNGSREAHRAIRRAMPFLRRARTVEIIIFDPAPSEREPGFRLAAMLSRHGIPVDIAVQPRSADTIGEALAHRARELGAGLLVMGAYGHSRFREYVLGGPTRSILETLPLRVLMAH
jgi:nucleotide-binding universal stress UspA family protein